MPVELAPVGMSVYTRIEHFKQSISALQANALADRSDLFIFSDAASVPDDEDRVQEVREFARNIKGFRSVCLTERDVNYGGTGNSFQAYAEIIERFGMSIYVEDDIVCAPGFLTYMNDALQFYKGDERVISISGYSPPVRVPRRISGDIFALNRISGWGMGSFRRTLKMAQSKINPEEFRSVRERSIFTENGVDVLRLIEAEIAGATDAGDVRCMYHQSMTGALTIYPRQTLVTNIGLDGTGVHCNDSERYNVKEMWDKTSLFSFKPGIEVDPRIRKLHCEFWGNGLVGKTGRFARRTGIYKYVKPIKDLIMP